MTAKEDVHGIFFLFFTGLLLASGPQYVQNKKQTVHESQTTHQTYSNTSQYKRSSDNVTIYNKTTTESLHYTTRRSTITHGAADKSPAVPGVNLIDTSATVYGNSLSSKCIATRTVPWFYIWYVQMTIPLSLKILGKSLSYYNHSMVHMQQTCHIYVSGG